jgi:hypothetical protein
VSTAVDIAAGILALSVLAIAVLFVKACRGHKHTDAPPDGTPLTSREQAELDGIEDASRGQR